MDAITHALETAGVRSLPPAPRAWVSARLERLGHCPEAHNLGGLLCCLPHDHTAGGCVAVPVAGGRMRHVARFPSWDRAAEVLVQTARRAAATSEEPAPDLPVGYTSTHPRGSEHLGFAPLLPFLAPALAAELLGPSAEQEATFRGLLSDWESFEREGVPAKHPELGTTHAFWVKFRDAWLSGRPDEANLNPAVEDANRVRRTLAEKAGKPPPPLRKGVDVEESTPTLKAAASLSDAVKDAGREVRAQIDQAPPGVKLAGGAALLVAGGVGLLYLAAPLLPFLLGGGRTVVQVEARAKRSRA